MNITYGNKRCSGKAFCAVLAVLTMISFVVSSACFVFAAELVDEALSSAAAWLKAYNSEPAFGGESGDWAVFVLSRSGTGDVNYYDKWYKSLEDSLTQANGVLSKGKYTEYSRAVLVATAIGKNAKNVAGYDLTLPLADFDTVTAQGVNGAAWALLSLDCGEYEIPVTAAGTQATRELYIEHLLTKETAEGGWSLTGERPDTDVTCMVLQALAKYVADANVAAAVDRALVALSSMQNENGGFSSYGAENAESCAQVIIALNELRISINDVRFVKNGSTVLDALFSYQLTDGSFSHTASGESNVAATEQALCALVAQKIAATSGSLYSIGKPAEEGTTENQQTTNVTEESSDTLPTDTTAVPVVDTTATIADTTNAVSQTESSHSPETGDNDAAFYALVVFGGSCLATAVVLIKRKNRLAAD